MTRNIVHLDADAFFASVEQAADTRLRGKPIAVGGESRGIIASASYEARRFGIYTPMPTARARKLCPQLIVLPGDYSRYEEFSNWMFGYAYDFTPDVERTSIDEGYFDVTANHRKSPVEIAGTIRRAIAQRLKISVSQGVGASKLISQIASKLNKPAAFLEVPHGQEAAFLHPLANQWLPGVGPKTSQRLNAAGLALIGQIAATPVDLLELMLGSQAPGLRQFARGIDERPIVPAREPQKSFSCQETFAEDVTDEDYVEAVLRRMADKLFSQVRQENRTVRTLTVRVRYNDRDEGQCADSLREPTDLETDIYGRLRQLLRQAWSRRVSLRMASLKLSNVYDSYFRGELPLAGNAANHDARERLAATVDDLRRLKGWSVVLRGHDLRLRTPPCAGVPAGPPVKLVFPAHVRRSVPPPPATYVPLRVRSYYSFLDSTLSPAAAVGLARAQGLKAMALTDLGNLHGAVEFAEAAKRAGIKPVFGAELRTADHPLLLYVQSAAGYHNLNRLLSRKAELADDEAAVATRQRQPVSRELVAAHSDGLIAVSSDPALAGFFPGRFYALAGKIPVPGGHAVVACPAIHYATPGDRLKYDIVQSIRTLTLLRQEHPEKRTGGRWHFRTPEEMRAGCRDHPEWLVHSAEIAERCEFVLPFGKPQFPAFVPPDQSTPHAFLHRLVREGLQRRYRGRAGQYRAQIEQELQIIGAVGYEEYFLVVWNFLQECRRQGIDWITRGSAADSLVCYCLGISDVCPVRFGLYFRRFLNQERMALNKLPDIDVDFPHDRKDDVVDLIFKMYGREHCAVVGGFSTFQARSAFADVAKVLGLGEREVRRFTRHFPWSFGGGWVPDEFSHEPERLLSPSFSSISNGGEGGRRPGEEAFRGSGVQGANRASKNSLPGGGAKLRDLLMASPENRDLPLDEEPYKTAIAMAEFLDGFPRHPKMHPCGVVLSRQPIHELTPTFIANKGYPTTHFDMDAVEAVGLVKIDVLAQAGLSALRDVNADLARRNLRVDFAALEPWQDPAVWEMIAGGGTRAVHHIESPAMTGLCRQCNVRDIDTLIAIVSVIRPGAANEGKKLAFTRRYQGLESVTYPHPLLATVLNDTFGLVVYEEHILQMCETYAGLPPGRADVLRRALNKYKRETIAEIRKEFFAAAAAAGRPPDVTEEVWQLVTGFSGYAFCKAHSTAYGIEAYQSAWLKLNHPAEFMAAVLSNGKGFYDPLVYVLEARRLGLTFLPPTLNEPGKKFAVHDRALRVPLTSAKGLSGRLVGQMLAAQKQAPFGSLPDFYRRVRPSPEELEILIRAGGFDEFGQPRTRQFWEAQHLHRTFGGAGPAGQGWLLPPPAPDRFPHVTLSEASRRERLAAEAELFGYPVSGHPLELYPDIAWDTYCPVRELGKHVGETVVACGLIVEQRVHHQITGEPMKFLTLADWTGMVETELFAATYKTYGLATVRYPVLEIMATVEPFENGRGFSLRVLRASKPRMINCRG